MTLFEIIDQYEAKHAPQPIRPTRGVALTPSGHALVSGARFIKALRALPAQERAEVLMTFATELRGVIAEIAYGA